MKKANQGLKVIVSLCLVAGIFSYSYFSSVRSNKQQAAIPQAVGNELNPNRKVDESSTRVSKQINNTGSNNQLPNEGTAPKESITPEIAGQMMNQAAQGPGEAIRTFDDSELPRNIELPPELEKQLNAPKPELPADLKAQLDAPPPELPEDMKRALMTAPRIVTLDEVNNPQGVK